MLDAGSTSCSQCGLSLPLDDVDGLRDLAEDPETQTLGEQLRAATLGEYDLYGPVGRGGMAVVFLAFDLALERPVAIKVMSSAMSGSPAMVERFKREARTAAQLSHPQVIPIYAVRERGGLVYFVMKYIEGRSLDAVLRDEGRLPLNTVRAILGHVASGLSYAHRRGVIHRDVKPANVLLDPEGGALLTDFGIAKASDGVALTSAGMIVGTPTYMSPEQFGTTDLTGASDQYSLGVMAYELLTGRPPFSATSVAEIMRRHLLDEPPPITAPGVPAWLAEAVLRMLAKNPEDRWETLEDFTASLQQLSREEEDMARTGLITLAQSGADQRPKISVPLSPVMRGARGRTPAPTTVPWRNRRVLGGAAAVAAVATVAGAALAVLLSSDPPSIPASPVGDSLSVTPAMSSAPDTAALPDARVVERTPPRTAPVRSPAAGNAASTSRRDTAPAQDSVAASEAVVLPPGEGYVIIGSRIGGAVLYVNGTARGFLSGLRTFPFPAGPLGIGVRVEGCTPWDTSVTVRSGDTLSIGYRNPQCPVR